MNHRHDGSGTGERNFYGLVVKNAGVFRLKCLFVVDVSPIVPAVVVPDFIDFLNEAINQIMLVGKGWVFVIKVIEKEV